MLRRLPNGGYACCKLGSRCRYRYSGAGRFPAGVKQTDSLASPVNWLSGSMDYASGMKQAEQMNVNEDFVDVPVVTDRVYNLIWRKDFQNGNPNVVPQIMKRLKYNRNFFTMEQMEPLLRELYRTQRIYDIHEIYTYYKTYWNYQIPYKSILEILINVEYTFGEFHECEKLIASYLQGNDNISAEIVLISLKTFIKLNNIPMCKEFFMQVVNNAEIFPLETTQFNKFIKFLHICNLSNEIEFFFNKWCQKGKPITRLLLISVMQFFLQLNDTQVWNNFLANDTIVQLKFIESNEFIVCKFINDCFQLQTFNIDKYNEILPQLTHDPWLLDFFHYKLAIFEISQNSIGKYNRIIDIDSLIEKIIDIRWRNEIVVKQFVRLGKLIELIQFYTTTTTNNDRNNIQANNEMINKLIDCFRNKYSMRDTLKLVDQIKKLVQQDVKSHNFFPNLIDTALGPYSKLSHEKLQIVHELIQNKQIPTLNKLIQQELILLDDTTIFQIFKVALFNNLTMVSDTIDNYIRDKSIRHLSRIRKLDLMWITYKIQLYHAKKMIRRKGRIDNNKVLVADTTTTSALSIDKDICQQMLYRYINMYGTELKAAEWRLISDQCIILEDYDLSSESLKMMLGKIKEQETLPHGVSVSQLAQMYSSYYMTMLKYCTRSKQIDLFLKTLGQWREHKVVYWTHRMKQTVGKYGKYFVTRACAAEEDVHHLEHTLTGHMQEMANLSQPLRDSCQRDQRQVLQLLQDLADTQCGPRSGDQHMQ